MNWFVRKNQKNFGPYSEDQLISMLQKKVLFPFDQIANAEEKVWKRLREFKTFQPQEIANLVSKNTNLIERRKNKRVSTQLPVLATNDKLLWKGSCQSLSIGGAKLTLATPHLNPGHIVTLHFHKVEGLKAFNVVGEIINKEYNSSNLNQSSLTSYIVRFLNLGPNADESLNLIINKEKTNENTSNNK